MKKLLMPTLSLLCVLGLVGCGNVSEKIEETPNEEVNQENVEVVPEIKEPVVESKTIENTKYFSIEFLEIWKGKYSAEIIDDIHISIHDSKSQELDFGGWLFSVELFEKKEEFDFLPSYELLGELKAENKLYYVVVIYPTDVQFTTESAESYLALQEDIPNVLESLTFVDSVEFSPVEK